jgi:DNA repair protein RadC
MINCARALETMSHGNLLQKLYEDELAVFLAVRSTALASRGFKSAPKLTFPSFGKLASVKSRQKLVKSAARTLTPVASFVEAIEVLELSKIMSKKEIHSKEVFSKEKEIKELLRHGLDWK